MIFSQQAYRYQVFYQLGSTKYLFVAGYYILTQFLQINQRLKSFALTSFLR